MKTTLLTLLALFIIAVSPASAAQTEQEIKELALKTAASESLSSFDEFIITVENFQRQAFLAESASAEDQAKLKKSCAAVAKYSTIVKEKIDDALEAKIAAIRDALKDKESQDFIIQKWKQYQKRLENVTKRLTEQAK